MIKERIYENSNHHTVKYFIGTEVEKTLAFGQKTLFVVGCQYINDILKHASKNQITHIYLGANQSFSLHSPGEWSDIIVNLLSNTEFLITFDFPLNYQEDLFRELGEYAIHQRFIPMISIPIANITKINYNTVIKFDDIGFNQTNPGVWCSQINNLLNYSHFTDWKEYKNDRIIE